MIRTILAICCPSTAVALAILVHLARTGPVATEDDVHGFREIDDAF